MPKSVDWSKQVGLELVKAGYLSLAKKNHPDHGGSHERMLVLTATKEHLEGILNNTRYTYQDPPKRPEPPPRRPKHEDPPRPKNMEKYAYGWWMLEDVECIRDSDKAILVQVPKEDEPIWFPKSQLHKNANEVWEYDDVGTIVFSEWIAHQKGWL
jgi:hypothetical protein